MMKYVSNLDKDLMFCDCDVESIKEHVGKKAKEYDSFFVKVGAGEYTEVWGIHGIVPHMNKLAYRIL